MIDIGKPQIGDTVIIGNETGIIRSFMTDKGLT